jgi:hypothetical protein
MNRNQREARMTDEARDILRERAGDWRTADWPEPSPIGPELPPVKPFRASTLPEAFRTAVEDLADRMQVPLDLPAAAVIVCLAGAVNRRARMQPKAKDNTWIVVPNLWGGIVAPPGFLKSPVLHAITAPLHEIERLYRAEYEAALEEFENERESAGLRLAAWKEQSKTAYKRGGTAPIRPDVSLARSCGVRAAEIAGALHGRRCGLGWIARCPAHEDRSPSLSITERDGTVLLHCHAGCAQQSVINALRSMGLWPEKQHHPPKPEPPPPEISQALKETALLWREAAVAMAETVLADLKNRLDPAQIRRWESQLRIWRAEPLGVIVGEYLRFRDDEQLAAAMVIVIRRNRAARAAALWEMIEEWGRA